MSARLGHLERRFGDLLDGPSLDRAEARARPDATRPLCAPTTRDLEPQLPAIDRVRGPWRPDPDSGAELQ